MGGFLRGKHFYSDAKDKDTEIKEKKILELLQQKRKF
jgi:hypothetical protein